ncbi:MAG: NAD+ synthase, partial [Nitrospinales bacterium]
PFVFANQVGGNDDLVFDGHSLIVAPDGKVQTRGNAFVEEMIFADIHIPKSKEQRTTTKSASVAGIKTYRIALDRTDRSKNPLPKKSFRKLDRTGEVYGALVLGARDYIVKNGFKKVVIGLSGGIDSALTAVIAAEALGAENVVGVLMPSPYSSQGSVDDSRELAANLGIQTLTFSIEKAMRAYDEILDQVFRGTESGIAEENLQARIRGNLLMALSNKMGWLVLTTGNKSEISVGYCTLYGDMAGGFAVIKDVPKMWVYRLSRYVNQQAVRKVIPQAIIDKEPSAELRPDQRDVDSLPPYPLLDEVLCRYVEEDKGIDSLKRLGFPLDTVEKVTRMVDRNEYKRRQGPPGIKITPKAFGRDRRLPITNHYKG